MWSICERHWRFLSTALRKEINKCSKEEQNMKQKHRIIYLKQKTIECGGSRGAPDQSHVTLYG